MRTAATPGWPKPAAYDRASGPHAWALYEWQLEAVQPLGVDDVELDQAVSLITGFAVNASALASTSGGTSHDDLDWWTTAAPVLDELTDDAHTHSHNG